MQQVKGSVQAAGEALKGAPGAGQAYRGGGTLRAAAPVPGGSGGGGGAGARDSTNTGEDSYKDEELSFIEPVYATRTAIHPAPQRELPQVSCRRRRRWLPGDGGRRPAALRPSWRAQQMHRPAGGSLISSAPPCCLQKTMPAYMAKVRKASSCAGAGQQPHGCMLPCADPAGGAASHLSCVLLPCHRRKGSCCSRRVLHTCKCWQALVDSMLETDFNPRLVRTGFGRGGRGKRGWGQARLG